MVYIWRLLYKIATSFTKAYSLKSRSKTLPQEVISDKIILLQQEADSLARKYAWPNRVPMFRVVHDKKATGAYINLKTRIITLTSKHLLLPIEHVRFTLAHEISHYHQEMTGNMPALSDAISYRKYIIIGLSIGLLCVLSYAVPAFISSGTMLDKLIILTSAVVYVLLTHLIARTIISKAQEQLIEMDADIKAIEVLKEAHHAVSYFSANQKRNYEQQLVCDKKINKFLSFFTLSTQDKKAMKSNFLFKILVNSINRAAALSWLLKSHYTALFSTHPTDGKRIQYLSNIRI